MPVFMCTDLHMFTRSIDSWSHPARAVFATRRNRERTGAYRWGYEDPANPSLMAALLDLVTF